MNLAASAAVVTALKLWLRRPNTKLRCITRRRAVTSVASVSAASFPRNASGDQMTSMSISPPFLRR